MKAGDVVRLKSGGGAMTVEGTEGDQVSVIWSHPLGDGTNYEIKRAKLQAALLEPAPKASPKE